MAVDFKTYPEIPGDLRRYRRQVGLYAAAAAGADRPERDRRGAGVVRRYG